MNSSLNNISHAAETSLSVAYNQSTAGVTLFTQVSYSIIATVAFGGNLLVILIFVQDKKLLKKSYNMLILSLAISDLLTAIFLVTNPAFVLGDVFPYPTNHMLGELFCRLIWSRVFLFQMVVFSVYICLALSIERWYAVVHPIKYQNNFNKTRTRFSIFFAWLWSLILCSTNIFEVSYLSTDPPKRRCTWNLFWGGNTMRGILGMVQVIFKMVLPSLVMLALLVHMVYKTNKYTVTSKDSRAKMRGKKWHVWWASLAWCWLYVSRQTRSTTRSQWREKLSSIRNCITPLRFWYLWAAAWIRSFTAWATRIIVAVTVICWPLCVSYALILTTP